MARSFFSGWGVVKLSLMPQWMPAAWNPLGAVTPPEMICMEKTSLLPALGAGCRLVYSGPLPDRQGGASGVAQVSTCNVGSRPVPGGDPGFL